MLKEAGRICKMMFRGSSAPNPNGLIVWLPTSTLKPQGKALSRTTDPASLDKQQGGIEAEGDWAQGRNHQAPGKTGELGCETGERPLHP